MRFVIHIGPRKTGTTFLQNSLYGSRKKLRAHGIFYHTNVPGVEMASGSRTTVGVALRRKRGHEIGAEFADAAEAGAHTAIISAEKLSRMTKSEILPLRGVVQRFAGADPVTVVAYCRRWSDRLPSLWAQHIKQGGESRDLASWVFDMMNRPKLNYYIDESRMWQIWARLFEGSLKIVSYDVMMQAGANITTDFLEMFADCRIDIPPEKGRSGNPRLEPGEVELLRRLNFFSQVEDKPVSARARRRLVDELREAADPLPARLAPPQAMSCVINDEGAVFNEILARMRAFAEPYLVPRDGDTRLIIPSSSRTVSPSGILASDGSLAVPLRRAFDRLLAIDAALTRKRGGTTRRRGLDAEARPKAEVPAQ